MYIENALIANSQIKKINVQKYVMKSKNIQFNCKKWNLHLIIKVKLISKAVWTK